MARTNVFMLACALALLFSTASAALVERTFNVGNLTVQRLCNEQVITAVNGKLPGSTVQVQEGDTLLVHVINNSPYNLTIHWHGVFQLRSGWADGPQYVTQCPIRPGNNYTYRFNITDQEGTLWWHAHASALRVTVHGALIIQPRIGQLYPFNKPEEEFTIVLGEWWNGNIVDIVNKAHQFGIGPGAPNAYTINGQPGDLYPCSRNKTIKLEVERGDTYLLRIINAALNTQFFFKIAQHNLTVVAIDAAYTNPYSTDVVVIAPGQTTDVLLKANQAVGDYYMAAGPYISAPVQFHNGTTTAIVHYQGAKSLPPKMPVLPSFTDTPTAHKFYTNLTSLVSGPHWSPCPSTVDERMFVTIGLGLASCGTNATCTNPFGSAFRFAGTMNNKLFQFPSKLSMLEAFHFGVDGIYTTDFPSRPPIEFNYTDTNLSKNISLLNTTESGTSVKSLKYNSVVEIVLQDTSLVVPENHPMHLHGFDFYVLAQGFGNYNETTDSQKFNLVNPQERNTIAVPVGGWAVIRFRANNPGIWFMHCHLEIHLPWGLAMAFSVENGPTADTSLPPPPSDLPLC